MSEDPLQQACSALARADQVVDRLHKMCCEPDRSPRMLAIKQDIDSAHRELETAGDASQSLDDVLDRLNAIGGQLGYLQVACCAPPRMPLYAEALENLTTAQLRINASMGRGH